jgi:ribonuclease HII
MPSLIYERTLSRRGFRSVAGVDEAGRGPLAGPLVAAAVILPADQTIKGIDDSKKLSPRKREILFWQIRRKAIGIGIGVVSHSAIDRINVGQANFLAMKKAVERLKVTPDFLLVDGKRHKIDLPISQRGINSGDAKCASIAAASIIAKVTRDRLMRKYHKQYPLYGFDRHKGYGTKRHLQLLEKHGPCPIHRRSFYPISSFLCHA